MVTPGVIVIRVIEKENTVEFYYNHKKQAQYTLKEASIKDMKWIYAVAATKAPKGEPAVFEFIGDQ